MNNVNTAGLEVFVGQVKKDPSAAVKRKAVRADWVLEQGRPQITATVEYPKGRAILDADMSPPMGGTGAAPDPVTYCLFGLASCFAATVAAIATERNHALAKLSVTASNTLNLSAAIGVKDEPMVEEAKLAVELAGITDEDEISEILEEAQKRCPGVYCLTHPIPLTVTFKRI